MKTTSSRALAGIQGEALARSYLESKNYRHLDSNFTRRVGELDLVMLEPAGLDGRRTIVFVEVRYRTHVSFGGAIESIDWKKQRKLVRVSSLWLQQHASSRANARIDVIAIRPLGEPSISAPPHTSPESGVPWRNHHLVWIKNAIESG